MNSRQKRWNVNGNLTFTALEKLLMLRGTWEDSIFSGPGHLRRPLVRSHEIKMWRVRYNRASAWFWLLKPAQLIKNHSPFADRFAFICKNRLITRHSTID